MSKFKGAGLPENMVKALIQEAVEPVVTLIDNFKAEIFEWRQSHSQAHANIRSRLAALESAVEALQQTPEPEEPGVPPEEPQGGFGDGVHVVAPLNDDDYDPAHPTVRTGRTLTAEEREYHAAFERAFFRPDPVAELRPAREFGSGDSYHIGRWGQTIQDPALLVHARTGDGRILDRLTLEGWRMAFDDLKVQWDAANLDTTYIREWADARAENGRWVFSGDKRPWSPYLKWLYAGNNGRAGAGTDLNRLQTIKPWGILVQYLYALERNRHALSPAGIDYGAEADRWKPVLLGFIDTWSKDTDEPWARNYTGLDGGILWDEDSSRAREGTWPIFVRGEGHAIYNSALFTYLCGRLGKLGWDIPNPDAALAAADRLVEHIRQNLMVPSKDSKGQDSLILKGGAKHTPMNATYTGYAAMSLAAMRDIGRWNDLLDDDTMVRISRAYDDMIRADGSTMKNLAAERDRSGHGMDVSGGSDRSAFQTAVFGCAYALIWGENDSLLNKALQAQASDKAGGLGDAKAHPLPAAMFAREVGVW